jgi:hypothetical protein
LLLKSPKSSLSAILAQRLLQPVHAQEMSAPCTLAPHLCALSAAYPLGTQQQDQPLPVNVKCTKTTTTHLCALGYDVGCHLLQRLWVLHYACMQHMIIYANTYTATLTPLPTPAKLIALEYVKLLLCMCWHRCACFACMQQVPEGLSVPPVTLVVACLQTMRLC